MNEFFQGNQNSYNKDKELKKYETFLQVKKNKIIKNIAGYAPCVPNAIRGVPKSMYAIKKVDSKKKNKTVHLVINNTNTHQVSNEDLLKTGMVFLKLAILLEKNDIRTRIDIVPKMSKKDDSIYGCSVKIKDYNQSFNLLKMAYPLAHTSFFRRQGFRYFETLSGDMAKFVGGYGTSIVRCENNEKEDYLKSVGLRKDGIIYLDYNDCVKSDYNPEKIYEDYIKK